MIWMPVAMAILGLAYMLIKKSWVMKQDAGDGKMKEISDHIYEGALAFLNAEYRLLTYFVIGASLVLAGIAFYMQTTYLIVAAFVIGAIFSAFAGNMGMKIATKTNVRPNTAKPATPNPITVPPPNDTFKAFGKLVLAACVVLTFVLVAIFIPMFLSLIHI